MHFRMPYLILLVMLSLTLQAQTHVATHYVRGSVRDSISGDVLEEATVSCWPFKGERPLQTLRSNKNGFLLRIPRPGRYHIIATYLGYIPDTITVVVSEKDTILTAAFLMQRSSKAL